MVTLRDFNVSMLGNTASCQTVGSSPKCAILKRTTFIKLAHRSAGTDYPKMQIAIAATLRERHRYDPFPCEYASEQGATGAYFRQTGPCAISFLLQARYARARPNSGRVRGILRVLYQPLKIMHEPSFVVRWT
jgi:hypothetical protein